METIGFISLGCEKNRVDSEVMLGYLKQAGYLLHPELSQAEIIIINTCGFIEAAKEESIEAILDAASYKHSGQCRLLLVAGCLAQRYGSELLQELPEIDGVLGNGKVAEIPLALEEMKLGQRLGSLQGSPGFLGKAWEPRVLTTPGYTAYLKIAEGCDNHCSYCAIPSIRGAYRSRTMEDVLLEAESLCAKGVKELILVAQETTRYGQDIYGKSALAELLQHLTRIDQCRWIRVLYGYPDSLGAELMETMVSSPKICRYIDLPLQHINNRILKLMNRRGTKEEIINLINKLRNTVPGLTLRTSFIVGFPGESPEEYTELLNFIAETRFQRVGLFGFSLEEGTGAVLLPERIPKEVIAQRVHQAMVLQQKISLEHNLNQIGRELTVLAEGWDEESKLYWGRTQADAPDTDGKVFFASEAMVKAGDFLPVKILAAAEYDLSGVHLA